MTKGELQVSKTERQNQFDEFYQQMAAAIANSCVNPEFNKPYHVDVISNAMKNLNLSLNPNKSVKPQISQVLQLLKDKQKLNIESAKLTIRIKFNKADQLFEERLAKDSNVVVEHIEKDAKETTVQLIINAEAWEKLKNEFEALKCDSSFVEILSNPLQVIILDLK